MAEERELYKQNLHDLLRVCIILGQILEEKELTDEELERIDYCTKNLKTITEKQLFLNKQK